VIERVEIRRGSYHDSIALMTFSRDARAIEGVVDAAAMMATPPNRELLARQGYHLPDEPMRPDDLLLAVRAHEEAIADRVAALFADWSSHRRDPVTTVDDPVVSREARALRRRHPGTNLLIVSVPGPYAAYEVAAGLEAGMNVFCFSSGVSVDDERALKELARRNGAFLMGPDCGTAILDGVGIGFANVLERGPVGIVGASGTGIQEVTCLLDWAKVGVSHAIGVGSRDLSDEVGGIMTGAALEALAEDPATETILVVSKPVGTASSAALLDRVRRLRKPVVACFVGAKPGVSSGGVRVVGSLLEAAQTIAADHGRSFPEERVVEPGRTPGAVRGLFCGGTLCAEAAAVAVRALGVVSTNVRVDGAAVLEDLWESAGHAFIDLGDEALTEGRLHPMIDPAVRNERALREGMDGGVGVLVMDVVLGYGAHPDPAAALAPLVAELTDARGGSLTVVVSVCGTDGDPQDLDDQWGRLEAAGAIVTRSAANAARIAVTAVGPPGPGEAMP
jgi:FdrA protein